MSSCPLEEENNADSDSEEVDIKTEDENARHKSLFTELYDRVAHMKLKMTFRPFTRAQLVSQLVHLDTLLHSPRTDENITASIQYAHSIQYGTFNSPKLLWELLSDLLGFHTQIRTVLQSIYPTDVPRKDFTELLTHTIQRLQRGEACTNDTLVMSKCETLYKTTLCWLSQWTSCVGPGPDDILPLSTQKYDIEEVTTLMEDLFNMLQ